mmetsp:Transcript_11285/g.14864  ORF Transcript_11285/g.14864 Transcript_11285/m.14864 type:complete len:151 (+) Transcript_11285:151-603(+)
MSLSMMMPGRSMGLFQRCCRHVALAHSWQAATNAANRGGSAGLMKMNNNHAIRMPWLQPAPTCAPPTWTSSLTSLSSSSSSAVVLPAPSSMVGSLLDLATWFIKRTYQPSIVKRKRKWGFLVLNRSVGGRKVLKRRRAKGRARLCGGIKF